MSTIGLNAKAATYFDLLAQIVNVQTGLPGKARKSSGFVLKSELFLLEQGTGVEPASSAWEADVLPMY